MFNVQNSKLKTSKFKVQNSMFKVKVRTCVRIARPISHLRISSAMRHCPCTLKIAGNWSYF